jgi:hypothetical protein
MCAHHRTFDSGLGGSAASSSMAANALAGPSPAAIPITFSQSSINVQPKWSNSEPTRTEVYWPIMM